MKSFFDEKEGMHALDDVLSIENWDIRQLIFTE